MTHPNEARARELVWCDACNNTGRIAFNATCRKCDVSVSRITTALSEAEGRGFERAVKIIRESDPLNASCSWEDADDIAHAVKKFFISKLKEKP